MAESQSIRFDHFLEKFPELPLPITLGEDTHHHFSQQNDVLPQRMIEQFILPLEMTGLDDIEAEGEGSASPKRSIDLLEEEELVEFIPCFKIPDTHDFHAIVYWRAGLMSYQYILVTFNKNGLVIDYSVIAGTYSDGKSLTQSVATITEDWEIVVVSGQGDVNHPDQYDAASSRATRYELLPDGKIAKSDVF